VELQRRQQADDPFWLYAGGFSQAGGTGDLSVRQFIEATADLLENPLVAQPLQVDTRHAGGIEIATPRDSLSTCDLQGAISVGLGNHNGRYKPLVLICNIQGFVTERHIEGGKNHPGDDYPV
jgi:hypothetical protein